MKLHHIHTWIYFYINIALFQPEFQSVCLHDTEENLGVFLASPRSSYGIFLECRGSWWHKEVRQRWLSHRQVYAVNCSCLIE